ncbi:MAG: zf-HC2 domain-containing protein [Gammaproteobacteria bacterium]|nr:zf-HC2 domain-containing protein [Gammaproteobacteria bacterium]
MLSCRDVSERASDLLDGSAPWRVRAAARLHLLMCQHCYRYLQQLRLTMAVLRKVPTAQPPVDPEKILSEVERRVSRP